MAHIPMDDVDELWSQLREHTWSGLQQILESHKGKIDGIDDELVDVMLQMTQDLQRAHRPFPHTERDLYELLNQQLAHAVHRLS